MEEKIEQTDKEQEIDLLDLVRKLWNGRKLILKWCVVGIVVGLIIGFSIPKEYTTVVKLSPELQGSKGSSGGFSALASMVNINLNSANSGDAVYPELYPDIVSSIPFTTDLFDVQIVDSRKQDSTTVYDYVLNRTRVPWWSSVLSFPGRAMGWAISLFKKDEDPVSADSLNTFHLTKAEMAAVKALNGRVMCSVDSKSSVVTLSVTMQDPVISALLTDTVMNNLQQYITDYRTNKARNDLEYTQMLFDEARSNYYKAQQAYARYMDQNQNIVLRSVRTEQERLQNEMNLSFSLYNQMAQQLQLAKAKVQESTPVYAVIQPATVPIKASKPSKMTILIGFIFLSVVVASGWILFGRDFFEKFRKTSEIH